MRGVWFIALLISVLAGPPQTVSAAELLMFESTACEWCEVWDEEVGTVYDKTAEAGKAPLRRVDIDDPWPPDLRTVTRINYTPTFVLMDRGKELGRIIGYPGEDFFWQILNGLMKKLPAPERRACATPGQTTKKGGKTC